MASTILLKSFLLSLLASALCQDIGADLSQQPSILTSPPILAEGKEKLVLTENTDDLQAKEFDEQVENAAYSFGSNIADGIMDNKQSRSEIRKAGAVQGTYSYSDGFFKRTVTYEADKNGYRIVNETIEPLGDGPKIDINGRADVSAIIDGQTYQYTITKDDIQEPSKVLIPEPSKLQ